MAQAKSPLSLVISLRPAGPADEKFLEALLADSRSDLTSLGLPPEAVANLLKLQFHAQRAEYQARYPRAMNEVIQLGAQPVGRCWTDLSDSELRLLDIAVLSDSRRRGVARAVLDQLCQRAASTRDAAVPIRLTVWAENVAARRLYASAGFREGDATNGYLSMQLAVPALDHQPHSTRPKDVSDDE
jgi:ribosomal protein S18 acetylase RimI-like enzyme